MDKKLFRREMKQRNRALSAEERRAASECIFSQVERLPAFAKAHCIAFFSALDDEPATDHFLERWHQSHRIVLPKVDGDEMDFFEYDPSTIEQGAFGIMEPSERSIKVSPSEIDLMIVPGVGFTLRFLNGMTVKEAIPAIIKWLEEKGIGEAKTNFKLRDWVFSRQRYWGEPIPIVHCPKCGTVPLPEDQLPLLLPDVDSYEPTDDGESPLSAITDWVETTCPCCGGPAKRETDTMPQWAGSSWYYLRYMDPHNKDALASKEALEYWSPVDWYNGGMEHTTLHLLYSRFWHKFLYDIGVVPTKEPYAKRTSHGMILGENPHYVGNFDKQEDKDAMVAKYGSDAMRPAVKMSKSLGNVINPDDVIREYGADTMRLYVMFIGDFEKAATWTPKAVKGCKRFLDRVWAMAENVKDSETEYSKANMSAMHKTIKKVSEDINNLKPNTAIAALMALLNQIDKTCNLAELKTFITLLSPFAPHICDEIWENKGFEGICSVAPWPVYSEDKCKDSELNIAVQVNGKMRGTVLMDADLENDQVVANALADEKIAKFLAKQGGNVVKTIVVKNKLVNLIVK